MIASAELRDLDFEKISRLVYDLCGINLHDGKKELVRARLGKRLREGGFRSFSEYYRHVTTEEGREELIAMIDSVSTNLTYFFREESHFRRLRQVMQTMGGTDSKKREALRIWSAGCSSGEEPYSLAITAMESLDGRTARDVRILATDISTRVVRKAVSGMYPREKFQKVPADLIRKYFQYGCGQWEGYYRVRKEIRDLVTFSRFNLMDPFPPDFQFNFIFCRNVMIYFDKKTQEMLVNKFYHCLREDGYFFVGHSESLTGLSHPFKYIEPSVYRR